MLDRLDHAVLLYIFNSYPEKITIQHKYAISPSSRISKMRVCH